MPCQQKIHKDVNKGVYTVYEIERFEYGTECHASSRFV